MTGPPTIASVTPLPIEADSRTFKQAATFARSGFRSIVVEGAGSWLSRSELPFELISVKPPAPRPASDPKPGGRESASDEMRAQSSRLERFVRQRYAALLWIRDYASRIRLTRRVLPEASLYVLHEYGQYPAVELASREHDATFIYDAHDFYSALTPEQLSAGYLPEIARLQSLIERVCVLRAAGHLTVAEGIAQLQWARFGRDFTVVRNAHDGRLDAPGGSGVRDAAGVEPDDFLVVAIGNAKPSMAIPETLSAFRELPEGVRLACVGRGYERYEAEVERLGIGDRVAFVGPVPPQQITSFVAGADLALVLYTAASVNHLHALPNRFYQSLAARLPLLYPDLPEMTSIARRYEVGEAVDLLQPESLAEGICRALEQPERLKKSRENAARASRELSWEREEATLLGVVREALAGAGS